MNRVKKALIIALFCCMCFSACAGQTQEVEISAVVYDADCYSFDELIRMSDVVVIGEYQKRVEHEYYAEDLFAVKEVLRGSVNEQELYLYSDIGEVHVEETGYVYETGKEEYEKGKTYILIVERLQSLFYDHDRYLLDAQLMLNESDGIYTLYSEKIEINSDTDIREYICSEYDSAVHINEQSFVDTDDAEEAIAASDHVAKVKIIELVNEAKVHNGNTYRCSISETYKGDNIVTADDGNILLVLLKNRVKAGGEYVIGFGPVSDGSVIYHQTASVSIWEDLPESLK